MATFGDKQWLWKPGPMWVLWNCVCRKHSKYLRHHHSSDPPVPVMGLRKKWGIQLVPVGMCSGAGGAEPVPLALSWGHICPPFPSASVCSTH